MKSIHLICVGKLKERFYQDACAEYAKRLSAYCKLQVVELPEERLPRDPAPAQIEKALEKVEKADEQLKSVLEGATAVMFSNVNKGPAVLIKEFRKTNPKPILKAAYVEESIYVGDQTVEELSKIKSKEELIGDIIMLLQSPAKNVISALQGSAGQKIAGLVKALEERN